MSRRIPVSLLIFTGLYPFLCLSARTKLSSEANQPMISTQDGHLIIQSASDRNITLSVGQSGYINVNAENLMSALQMVKDNNQDIRALKTDVPSNVEERLLTLEQRLDNLQPTGRVEELLNQMTSHLSDLTNRLDTLESRMDSNDQTLAGVSDQISTMKEDVNNLKALLTSNECSSNPCRNGGTCVDQFNSFFCRCPANCKGTLCDEDVNECSQYAGTDLGCQNGATCVNTPGSYSCTCPPNYYGVRCTETHDDCSGASSAALCDHGTCINQDRTQPGQPKYRCICDEGWTTNGLTPACSTDVDECNADSVPCSTDPEVLCINTPGSFTCGSCPPGYEGNGFSCRDVDECQNNNGGCSMAPLVECVNTRGSRSCGACPPGYIGDGITCSYIGVCNQNNGGCHPLAVCSELGGGNVMCTCPPGYQGNGIGANGCISSGTASCSPNPCVHGTCTVMGASYQCTCEPGFTGVNCQVEINECQSAPCQNGGTCVDQLNGYFCVCPDSYSGMNCQDQQETCGGVINGFANSLRYPREEGETHPHNVDCSWQVKTLSDKILMVTVNHFNLESHPNCEADSLEIFDGPSVGSRLLGRFCGATLPLGGQFNSTHNELLFHFTSDQSVATDGFQFSWTSADPVCGGNIQNQDHGTISSPGYPGVYPSNRDCVWTITVPLGKKIQFTFGPISIGSQSDCEHDYLVIYDGLYATDPELQRFCDSVSPEPLTTSGSSSRVYFHSDDSSSYSGFQINFVAIQGIPGCGASYTTGSGVLISPNYPNDYPPTANCEWTVTVPDTEVIRFNFTNIDVENRPGCTKDAVVVRDGGDETAPFHGRYCGTVLPAPFTTTQNQLYVQFTSDATGSGPGFRATWDVPCGGVFTESAGELRSPYHPNPYPTNKVCEYLITQPEGSIITVTFTAFDIEAALSGCFYDYLEVRDGASADAPFLGNGVYCGAAIPQPLVSTGNNMWLRFVSDGIVTNHGFKAVYEASEGPANDCGGTFTESSGSFRSPGHPTVYPHGANCTYTITVQDGLVIRLVFTSFTLEGSTDCRDDHVEVFSVSDDGTSTSLGKFCGNTLPPALTSSGRSMKVVFTSDESIAAEGFSAAWAGLNVTTACGGNILAATGVIMSPNYPDNYPHNRDCVWTITAQQGQQVLLNFTDFHLEQHNDCDFDFLEIRNGGYATAPLIGQFCGESGPGLITSFSNQVYIRFKSDNIYSAKGFRMTFDGTASGCGGQLTSPTGSIVSPNYPQAYHHNGECYWDIITSHGSGLHLFFIDLDLEDHSACFYDYIQVFEVGPEGKELGKFCGTDIPDPIFTSKNKLYIKFRSDYVVNGRGFHLSYQSDCNNKLTEASGVIESPNFPNPYPYNRDCTWDVEVTRGNAINGSFSHFDIEDHSSCQKDYLQLIDGESLTDPEIGKYCGGSFLPPSFATSGSHLMVKFVSDQFQSSNGFRMEYLTNGCGGLLTSSSGSLTSPNYPQQYPHDRTCVWNIRVSPGSSIQLTISDFDVENHPDCQYDVLEVYGGPDSDSPRLTRLCGPIQQPVTLSSTGNHMYIIFTTDPVGSGRGFSATYQEQTDGCGGVFTAPSGSIQSKNFPQPYDTNSECEWTISVAAGRSVVLTFTAFDVEFQMSCNYDAVYVYDGDSVDAPLLIKACGAGLPTPHVFRSTDNVMFVRMVSDNVIPGTGFSADYVTGCGGHRDTGTDGEIFSPGWPNNYEALSNCTWIIEAPQPGDKVTLTFTHLDIEQSVNCQHDSVVVLDGNNPSAPQIDQYCSSTVPPPVTSSSNALTVIFISDAVIQRSGFRATYSSSVSACGGDLTAENGAFTSPGYPNSYPNNVECVWTVTSSPGARIQLSFSLFSLEQEDNCNHDYLEIREVDAAGSLIGRYCGTTIPETMTTGHVMWVRFRSNEATTGQGFMAQYSSVYGGEVTGTSGQIASPHYPNDYPLNQDWSWVITVPADHVVQLTFVAMAVEPDPYNICNYDYVKIRDGGLPTSPVLGTFCGYMLPPVQTSTGSQMGVTFYSDYVVNDDGFLVQWNAILAPPVTPSPGPPVSGCGGDLIVADSPQTFTSPGYPAGYAPDLNCRWTLQSAMGYRVQINLTHVDLEPHTSCQYDRIAVYNGSVTNPWYTSRVYCGQESEGTLLHSYNNFMTVFFTTDSSNNRTGFSIDYKTMCGGDIRNQPSGVIQSLGYPEYYEPYSVCDWTVRVTYGRTIHVTFNELQIGQSNICTEDDYLELFNGWNGFSPSLGRFCGTATPSVNETTSYLLFVRFRSSTTTGRWKLTYEERTVACGGQRQITDQVTSGEISSPNYPENYPVNSECTWVILSPAATSIQLDFVGSFDIENHDNCIYDYVEVRDGGTVNAPLLLHHCGTERPSTVKSTSNVMYIRFRSDQYVPRSGFKAEYKIASCGGTVAGLSGSLSSPGYPQLYPSNSDCVWKVEAPSGHSVTFTFEDFQLEPMSDCLSADFLEIREHNATGLLLARVCGYSLPAPVESLDNDVYVLFHSNNQNNFKGFNLDFEASTEVCGGQLTTPSGSFTSPGYPYEYPHQRECRWTIVVAQDRRVTLTFSDFRVGGSTSFSCYQDYVEVYNGQLDYSPFLVRVCGLTVPEPIQSSGNTMLVVFKTDGSVANHGFSAQYHSQENAVCGGLIVSDDQTSGYVTSPNFGNGTYGAKEQCVWSLESRLGVNSSIVIDFVTVSLQSYSSPPACAVYADFLEFREGVDYTGNLIGRYCGNMTDVPRLGVPGNHLWASYRSNSYAEWAGFKVKYTFTECGGILTDDHGVITSPNYPSNYNNHDRCSWLIRAPEGTRMKLSFTDMELEEHEDCKYDYVKIYNGGLPGSPTFGTYCGTTPPADVISQSHEVRVEFVTDVSVGMRGFRLQYTFMSEGCGAVLHGTSGVIQSPNYPVQYPPNQQCFWQINVPAGYHVTLQFTGSFHMEVQEPCTNDFVQLFDYDLFGDRRSIQTFCGIDRPSGAYNSTASKMEVLFQSNGQIEDKGFQATYNTGCGGVYTGDSGVIVSPNYPNDYDNNLLCTYQITVDRQKYIVLTFKEDHFDVEMAGNCIFDYVSVYPGNDTSSPPLLDRYCGMTSPQPVSSLGAMLIVFRTDSIVTRPGWLAEYEATECGGVYTDPSGTIRTPTQPADYHSNANCTWVITIEDNRAVELKFNSFDVEVHPDCDYDSVSVYDGALIDPAKLLGTFCGDTIPSRQRSLSNQMLVNFLSDNSVVAGGFTASYRTTFGVQQGCGGVQSASSGVLASVDIDNDGQYESDLDCVWTVSVPTNKVVKLHFTEFELEGGATCAYDFLEIRDGMYADDRLIGKFCGTALPDDVIAASNVLYVRFYSDSSIQKAGFSAEFSAEDALCGGTLTATSAAQVVTSPGYPDNYPHNLNCRWVVDAPDGEQVLLTVTDFDVQGDVNCQTDYLEIRDYPLGEDGQVIHHCDQSLPAPFRSVGGTVFVNFVTDAASTGRGFSIKYQIASCNRTYTGTSGRLLSPGWPGNYPKNAVCNLQVAAPSGTTLSLFYNFFFIEPHVNCSFDYLKIYDGQDGSAPVIDTVCGNTLPDPVVTSGKDIYLEFRSDNSVQHPGFDITYVASEQGCGGNITDVSGSFASPGYPGPNPLSSSCDWLVTVPARRQVALEFTSFSLGPIGDDTTCLNNYVTLFDGPTADSPVVGTYCGTELPAGYTGGRKLLVRYISDGTSTGSGFRATFNS